MVREIYIRTQDDPYYKPGMTDFVNEMESVITQVKVLLGTEHGDVLGEYNMGIDIEHLVFNTRRAAISIEDELRRQIRQYVYHGKNITIDVKISFGKTNTGSDMCLIDLIINGSKAIGFLVDRD